MFVNHVHYQNKDQGIPKGQSKMETPEKLSTQGTQDTRRRQTKEKHNTICVGHHYMQANSNNHVFIQL